MKPAFPRAASEYTKSGTLPEGNNAINEQDGMSLLEYYAGQAAVSLGGGYADEIGTPHFATRCFEIAAAMCAEAERRKIRAESGQ